MSNDIVEVVLPVEIIDDLTYAARSEGVTRQALVRKAVMLYLNNKEGE